MTMEFMLFMLHLWTLDTTILIHFLHFSKTNKPTNKRPNKTKIKKTFIRYIAITLSVNTNSEQNGCFLFLRSKIKPLSQFAKYTFLLPDLKKKVNENVNMVSDGF